MNNKFFISIDFDGTVTPIDITNAIIKRFAMPGWERAERLWEDGTIGSRECLATQMSLIATPMEDLLTYARNYSVHDSFGPFLKFLRKSDIPHAIISDGFSVFIEQILSDAGIGGVPIYANRLTYEQGLLKTIFLHTNAKCSSATCKCETAERAGGTLPVVHIGDGESDFCLAEKAAYVFSKRKLTSHCRKNFIPHSTFDSFSHVEQKLRFFMAQTAVSEQWTKNRSKSA
ncbi:MAG TPA: MtnX-like HAD-IB family phosphatase [Thermodesulfovibrionales bacterium]|nr:MtnX-like HAD-IB family phosphatase [Thermodesulfovibrionales bacterium]